MELFVIESLYGPRRYEFNQGMYFNWIDVIPSGWSTIEISQSGHQDILRSFMVKLRIRDSLGFIGMMGCNVSQLAWNFVSLPQLIRSAKLIFYATAIEQLQANRMHSNQQKVLLVSEKIRWNPKQVLICTTIVHGIFLFFFHGIARDNTSL